MNIDKLRKEFPVTSKGVYANTPVYGPLYDGLLDWRQEHDLDMLLYGSEMRDKSVKIIADTRNTVAKFFGATRNNVALLPNFSTGLNFLVQGLPSKTKVLLLAEDYPSVNWPFEQGDFAVSYLNIAADIEAKIYETIRQNSIAVLALSMVQWQDGFVFSSTFFNELKQRYPDLIIVVDGTQFCGTRNFNFKTSGIDVLGASGYKWLLGGYGNGFMLFNDEVQQRFSVRSIGFNSAEGDVNKRHGIRLAKRLEPGHLSPLSFGSLQFSLNYLSALGMDRIWEHNKTLVQMAKQEFFNLGVLKRKKADVTELSTIISIEGNDTLFKTLQDNRVVCSQRGTGIRFGFHFYNTESDVNTIVSILKRAL